MLIVHHKTPVGFFSSYNTIVGTLYYLKNNNITDFHIVWNNPLYQQEDSNLFDIFFYKQVPLSTTTGVHTIQANEIGNIYEPILKRELFTQLNQVLHFYNYFENKVYKNCLALAEKRPNSLGVHVRRTDHGEHSELLDLAEYFHIIDEKLLHGEYTGLYITTDEIQVISEFKKRYGNILYYNKDVTRSKSNTAIHFSQYADREKLATDVMIDALSLASCEEIIITSSNIAGYTLMINPRVKYTQIDTHKKHY